MRVWQIATDNAQLNVTISACGHVGRCQSHMCCKSPPGKPHPPFQEPTLHQHLHTTRKSSAVNTQEGFLDRRNALEKNHHQSYLLYTGLWRYRLFLNSKTLFFTYYWLSTQARRRSCRCLNRTYAGAMCLLVPHRVPVTALGLRWTATTLQAMERLQLQSAPTALTLPALTLSHLQLHRVCTRRVVQLLPEGCEPPLRLLKGLPHDRRQTGLKLTVKFRSLCAVSQQHRYMCVVR